MGEYDPENIFAQILDKKMPVFKVFESRTSLAFVDPYPMAEGHTVVIPKIKGHTDLVSMPPAKSAAFLADVQRVARAVKVATGATGINIWQNNGEDAGQTIFHPHVHIIPRMKGDGLKLNTPPSQKEQMTAEQAAPLQQKIEAALNPPKPLKKAKFGKVSNILPDSSGLNLKLKVVGDPTVVETKAGKFWEVLCGDPSGTVVVSLREHQKDIASKDAVIALRNAAAKMVANHVRLAVDKWGKIEASDEGMEEAVEMAPEKNVSATEYELVVGK
jgi:histidine triad (HIT) family protein